MKQGWNADFPPALLDPGLAAPAGLVDQQARPAGRRFDVYRNNVVVSLKAALATGFPVIEKLVGTEFFAAMAGVFVRAHPPTSPVLAMYGEAFPAFLASFEPVAHLPYLADTARLEYALRQAYHAADARPATPGALDTPRLAKARLQLAPATRLVASPYPIGTIWRANTEPGAPPARGGAESVLVTRPDWDPKPVIVPEPAARLVAALLAGKTLGEAVEAAGPALDLAGALTLLIQTKSITRIEVPA
ncbi:MAG: putative DNA-binding domain-containing protein [Maritimibacter sp.]|nr:putative DNA-binding domain-containing protein [Maritimibacter sp.]